MNTTHTTPETWKLVPVEPTEAMEIFVHKQAWINAVDAAPAPPVPASVQEIMRLIHPYVRTCVGLNKIPESAAAAIDAFKPLEAALTALVEKNHELQFSLDGVNAMRRPLTDEQIDEIANDGMRNAAGGIYATRVYEFARAIEKAPGIEPEQGEVK